MMYFCNSFTIHMTMFKNKSFLLFLSVFFALTVFISCKKDNPAVEGTTWRVDTTSFVADKNGGFFFQNDTAAIFGASSKSKDVIFFIFKTKPSPGVYNVINTVSKPDIPTYDDNECSVIITTKNPQNIYLPVTDDVGTVNISVSGKKMIATFSDLKLGFIDPLSADIVVAFASGSIIEK